MQTPKPSFSPRRGVVAFVALFLAALTLAGCASHVNPVDAEVAGTSIERGESQLLSSTVAEVQPVDGLDSLLASSGFRFVFLGMFFVAVVLFVVSGWQTGRRPSSIRVPVDRW